MQKELLVTIDWKDVVKQNTYLYGTKLTLLSDAVIMSNPLFVSGKAVKIFRSKTNYQANRVSPELPILMHDQDYFLELNLATVPAERYFIQVEFFNRQEESIGIVVLRPNNQSFKYPKLAYSYTISIMTAGCHELTFSSLSIYRKKEITVDELEQPVIRFYYLEDLPEELELVKPLIKTSHTQ
ncbi:MAG: accessory Sec system protein Asp3 [Streptococcus orisratti]|nr:accessory Sec system protein Asp3 [Streptococcus orisratti]